MTGAGHRSVGGPLPMLVIVGHGPSVAGRGLGSWLDTQTVVRLKWANRPVPEDFGTRTDYVCGSSPHYWIEKRYQKAPEAAEFWLLPNRNEYTTGRGWDGVRKASIRWLDLWDTFRTEKSRKPSTGLRAIFCAMEFLNPPEIGLIGFDMVLHPDVPTFKWNEAGQYAHDAHAEHRCVMSLGVKITEV